MSSFEEQFPELRKLRYYATHLISLMKVKPKRKEDIPRLYWEKDVEKFCLSKQRVKEAIEKHIPRSPLAPCYTKLCYCNKCELLKELGLNEEE